MKIKRVLIIILFAVLGAFSLTAQKIDREVIATAGSFESGGSMSMEWTLGEVLIETFESAGMGLTQGFHQPDVLTIGISESAASNRKVAVFPNPSTGQLYFKVENNREKYSVGLYDMLGKVVCSQTYSPGFTTHSMNLENLPEGAYVLKLEFSGSRQASIHKIIKK